MKTNRQQILLIAAIAGLGFLAADRLLIMPLSGLWKDRSDRIAELQQSIDRGQSLIDRDAPIRERWASMQSNTLPVEISVAENDMFRSVERWSQSARVNINSIKPQWRQFNEHYMTLECRIDASGALGALARFIYELEGDPMGLRLEHLDLSSRDTNAQQMVLTLQVSGLLLTPSYQ